MRVGAERDLALTGEQGAEVRVAGEVGAHHQGVGEEADRPFDLAAVAVGDGGADGEVGLPGVAQEQGVEAAEEDHEEGDVGALGERAEPLR